MLDRLLGHLLVRADQSFIRVRRATLLATFAQLACRARYHSCPRARGNVAILCVNGREPSAKIEETLMTDDKGDGNTVG